MKSPRKGGKIGSIGAANLSPVRGNYTLLNFFTIRITIFLDFVTQSSDGDVQ